MPTGYTAAIKDGITFEQYAMSCARAFGALAMMRDEPSDAVIPEEFPVSDYHTKAIKEAEEKLTRLKLLPFKAIEREAEEANVAAASRHAERINDANALRNKYEAMLADVNAWIPPTDEHIEFKNFMAKQLTESIDFDCDTSYYTEPEALSAADWHKQQIEQIEKSILYHRQQHVEEVKRTQNRNSWVKGLRDSLKKG